VDCRPYQPTSNKTLHVHAEPRTYKVMIGAIRRKQLRKKWGSTESSSSCVSAVRPYQDSHHLVERSNVELSHRVSMLQPVLHRMAGIE
jgi:hypothetical protein